MEFEDITDIIIGGAYRVYNTMGFGFLESVYEKCMLIELAKAGIEAASQKPVPVYYNDELVGDFRADIVVGDSVIVELKSVSAITKAHEVQLVNYLVATNIQLGLLINFGEQKVEIKRKYKTFDRQD